MVELKRLTNHMVAHARAEEVLTSIVIRRDALGYSDVVSGYSLADILCADGAAQPRSHAILTVLSIAAAAGVKSTPDPSSGVSSHAVMAGADGRIADLNRS